MSDTVKPSNTPANKGRPAFRIESASPPPADVVMHSAPDTPATSSAYDMTANTPVMQGAHMLDPSHAARAHWTVSTNENASPPSTTSAELEGASFSETRSEWRPPTQTHVSAPPPSAVTRPTAKTTACQANVKGPSHDPAPRVAASPIQPTSVQASARPARHSSEARLPPCRPACLPVRNHPTYATSKPAAVPNHMGPTNTPRSRLAR